MDDGVKKMKSRLWKVLAALLATGLVLSVWAYTGGRKARNLMISEFGKYQGYSEAVYDGSQRDLKLPVAAGWNTVGL